ncbi:hypothetical protein BJ138DRAFT_1140056 [Hygrophoropsis aurantiaca]|uniref:Uncharacterized protein n=1 Tax=Hygrophoropsis aurantiaca TaxID=72124 RepID=A0ACB8ARU4_9AGAM|nr:hypothetical protein BJ138DRAFT_1140056 [Hygrophoropsis aurantiaca]
MATSTVSLRVELPSYSHSFSVEIPASSTIHDVKTAISHTCPGRPAVDGQKIIWRGRYLADGERISDVWKSPEEQRIVHLAVHPSAWTAAPPTTVREPTPTPTAPEIPLPATVPIPVASNASAPNSSLTGQTLPFIAFRHQNALRALLLEPLLPSPSYTDLEAARCDAKKAVEQQGYVWPDLLDDDVPTYRPDAGQGVVYERTVAGSKSYLLLRNRGATPTARQIHALKVLTYTFSLIPLPPPPRGNPPAAGAPVPPHVNELLQHLGLPTLRAVPNATVQGPHLQFNPNANPNALNAQLNRPPPEDAAFQEIPVRALLAPLMMVILRTLLLLYFFSPTRKPLIGLCLIAYVMYEMWTHVRIVVLRPANQNQNQNQNQEAPAPAAAPAPAPPADGVVPPPTAAATPPPPAQGPAPVQGPSPPELPETFLDVLAQINIHEENKALWPTPGQRVASSSPPGWKHRAWSFVSLLVVTLHPAVWNRRRKALRQREGRLRMEMNAMEREEEVSGDGEEDGTRREERERKRAVREQLLAQHARRPQWALEYITRVRGGEWVDE